MSSLRPQTALIAAFVAIGVLTAGCSSTTAGHPTAAGVQPPSSSHGPQLGNSTGSSASPTPGATSASPSPSPSAAPPKASVVGWQPVGDHVRKIAYDAPPGFKVLNPSAPLNVGTDKRLEMFAGSQYRTGFCPSNSGLSRATAGIASAFQGTMDQVAHTLARFFAREVFEKGAQHAKLTVSKTKALKVAGTHAVEAQAVVTKAKGTCGAPKSIVDVIVLEGGGSNGIFVLMADQGVKSAISTNTINKIVGSVRRLPS